MVEDTPKLKIVSWNINGLRTLDMQDNLAKLDCSILSVQETKLTRKLLDQSQIMPPGYSSYFSFSTNRIGYSGVATFCRDSCTPIKAEDGLCKVLTTSSTHSPSEDDIGSYPELEGDDLAHVKHANSDGRTVITQHLVKLPDGSTKPLTIINVYCPRLRDDPEEPSTNNTDFKRTFHEVLHRRAQSLLEAGSFVVLLGDMNIRHRWIDQCDVTDPKKFVTNEFRQMLDSFLSDSSDSETRFIDSFRMLHPDKESAFTCWCTLLNARENNYGSRLDYIFVDIELAKYVEKAEIHSEVMGSDHCPISITLHSLAPEPASNPPPFATKYYAEFGGKQKNLKEFFLTTAQQAERELVRKESEKCEVPNASKKRLREEVESSAKGQSVKRVQTNLRNFFVQKPTSKSTPSSSSPPSSSSGNKLENDPEVVDCIVPEEFKITNNSSNKWKELMKAPSAPLCEGHKEPCVKRTVRKKGSNLGRQFWACSHGVGKSDDPNANCNYFMWAKASGSKNEK